MKATSKVERYYFSSVVPQKIPLNETYIMVCCEAFWWKERENNGTGLYGKDAKRLADKLDENLCNFV